MILTQLRKRKNLEISWPITINQYIMRNKYRKQKTASNQSKQIYVLTSSIQILLQTG